MSLDYTDPLVLNNFFLIKDKIERDGKNNRYWAFDIKEPERSRLLFLQGKNSYGTRHQNLLVYESGGLLVDALSTEDQGDFKNTAGEHFEMKTSYSSKIGAYSFWQIRPWQKLKGYVFKTIDRKAGFRASFYYLTKEQLFDEIKHQGFNPTHITKEALKNNERVEITLRYKHRKKDKALIDRWENVYRTEDILRCLTS